VSNSITENVPVYKTCKKSIEFMPWRFLILGNENKKEIFYYHYFFPCWDMEYFCQKYPQHKIVKVGFVHDEEILDYLKKIQNIKRNEHLWY